MQSFEELLNQLRGADDPTAYNILLQLTESAMKATRPGAESERQALAATIRTELSRTPETPADQPAKAGTLYPLTLQQTIITRLLCYVAGDEEIPFLAGAMTNLDIREAARCALACNPSPAATKALIDALNAIGPEFLTGVVSSLGQRQCPEAMTALQKLAVDETYDMQVRLAAVDMLANYPEPANDEIILAIAQSPCSKAKAAAARVRLAETLNKVGNKNAARNIYQAIKACKCDHPAQKKAAELALQNM
ncbi:MAG: hypothetical protein GXY44_08840 [Phycisphaerales bacterium]|nr:hypothetical protein [Phycisphaerales bacterium]